jgi:hypothetical protein
MATYLPGFPCWEPWGALGWSGGTAVLAIVILATPGPVEGFPDVLAGLPLTHRLDGADARLEIDRLHGKTIRVRAATVAHYERPGTVAMLYVSDAYLRFVAARQLQAMIDGMSKGESPSALPREFQQAGQRIFWTLGQGQAHFYYRRGSKVIWLAADEQVAFPALAATLRAGW